MTMTATRRFATVATWALGLNCWAGSGAFLGCLVRPVQCCRKPRALGDRGVVSRNSECATLLSCVRAPIQAPALNDADLVKLGAGHFHGGCASCHGAPGIPVSPIARHMLPPPPDLATSMRPWKDEELFWIVQHGIKYTGMPGWVAIERADEIWAVVAFLKRMPQLDAEGYSELAFGSVRLANQNGRELATVESNPQSTGACARCHGAEASGPTSALVPRLAWTASGVPGSSTARVCRWQPPQRNHATAGG